MSNYIMDLRKIVGHRPLLQVGASVIVVDSDNRILLQLRSDNHCWGYAGGSVELDEVVEDAAKRGDADLRVEVAKSTYTSAEILYYLSGDAIWNVCWEVARNPKTPANALIKLAEVVITEAVVDLPNIHVAVARNPNTPVETLISSFL